MLIEGMLIENAHTPKYPGGSTLSLMDEHTLAAGMENDV